MVESVLKERVASIATGRGRKTLGCSGKAAGIECEKPSVSGAVSQRACVFCGARVVLNPITDAFHIIHGPIGCASYTWDIRGSLTSKGELYRNSYSTDLGELDIVFGGEKRLAAAIEQAVEREHPKVVFVYATCIVGVIGDDVEAVCRDAEQRFGIRVIPVMAPGFSGTKSQGYRLAGEAIMRLIRPHYTPDAEPLAAVNFLGDFNLAGETWIVRRYLEQLGVPSLTSITGDSHYDSLIRAPRAALNLVQCAGSMVALARQMQEEFHIPFQRVSFYGIEDTSNSLIETARHFGPEATRRAREFVEEETARLWPLVETYRERLAGKCAAIYVGGGFKAISLIRQFAELGVGVGMVGTQTGQPEDYEIIRDIVGPETVVLDDANPAELEKFMREQHVDILVGGVKERPLAYKLGVAFCDHNHERKHPLAGFIGVENFAREIADSLLSPVWRLL
ncbi:MAG: nitrogenase iron-molybdenum cofactor biosynthesis protein NifE [Coriobacteriales bacterium]|jgi:nitrogenase molybdenum-cofactor synthesis protein NifE|nr:nitrogenase iron-molybdenum cofactor biosynthesis protein NifE [Coriobacteriales bacterium]